MGKWQYGVILDAGSSGTRVHIYRWLKSAKARHDASPGDVHKLPTIKTHKKWTKKVKPGISTFASHAHEVGPEHLHDLFEHALEIVPKEEVGHTPIFLFATAGVRLLEDHARRELLSEICRYAQEKTKFHLPDCDMHIKAITGQTEGLYGWLASNYLLGAFNNPGSHTNGKSHHTYGFLDLGGASAQIAFAPNSTEAKKHSDDLQLLRLRTIDGVSQEFRVFVTTFLGYGVNEARRRYLDDLSAHHDSAPRGELPDPCLPRGMHKSVDAGGSKAVLVGTGKFSECLARTLPLLETDAPCEDSPCLFHGVHVPSIDFGVNHFVGVSEYWHTTHEIFEMGHADKAYDFQTYQNRVLAFCNQDWDAIEEGISSQKWGKKVDSDRAAEVCFKASWLINMLHEGIKIPRVGLEQSPQHTPSSSHTRPQNATKEILHNAAKEGYLAAFQAVNKIDNTEVSWTLGKMVLYASSQIPPATSNTADVGFGPNAPNNHPGIPETFQHAGGSPDSHPLSAADLADTSSADAAPDTDSDSDDDDFFSNPWSSKHPLLSHHNRGPGLLLIALIILIVLLLIGRDRRAALLRKFSPFSRSTPWSAGKRGDSSSKGRYERLLEEGDASRSGDLRNPGEFELESISGSGSASRSGAGSGSSDEDATSASSRASQASGRKRVAHTPTGYRSPRGGVSAVGLDSEGVGLGLSGWGGSGLNRRDSGLREGDYKDAIVGTGYRSRGPSPSRLRSPLVGGFKENVD